MKVALYARVSTDDQDCASQLLGLRSYAEREGWEVATEYTDTGYSGRKDSRPALDKLMSECRSYGAILVWKLDRFSRSLISLDRQINALRKAKVRFISVTQGVDTSEDNPTARFFIHMLSAFAEFEVETIRERIRAGLRVAKANGMALGRKRRVFRRDEVVEMRRGGKSWGQIAKHLSIPVTTVRCAYAEITGEGTAVLGTRSKKKPEVA
jgi:DNA invertase Pin-like site-specific DNA recombinase